MNKFGSLMCITGVLIMVMLILPGCGSSAVVEEPVIETANGGGGTSGVINDVTPDVTPQERRDPVPVTVPRVNQAKVIGVVRELVNSGCIVKTVGTIDGIHFSQLKVTCGDPQAIPGIE